MRLCINFDDRFGYSVVKFFDEEDYAYGKINITDMQWIRYLEIEKDFYIDSLLTLGAYQNASREFPRLYFKNKEDAEKALKEFYEPMIVAKMLAQDVKYNLY